MSSLDDLRAAAGCADNHDVYRAMVELEAASTFASQGQRWLADVAPTLLPDSLREAVTRAKHAAAQRQAIEAEIPDHLLFSAGWPTTQPTQAEAELLASVRTLVVATVGLAVRYTGAASVLARSLRRAPRPSASRDGIDHHPAAAGGIRILMDHRNWRYAGA